jgi:hypothetical protein
MECYHLNPCRRGSSRPGLSQARNQIAERPRQYRRGSRRTARGRRAASIGWSECARHLSVSRRGNKGSERSATTAPLRDGFLAQESPPGLGERQCAHAANHLARHLPVPRSIAYERVVRINALDGVATIDVCRRHGVRITNAPHLPRGSLKHEQRHANPRHGAVIPLRRRPATRVVTFQCPCGTGANSRKPRVARPQRRAILVAAHVRR